MAEPLIPESNPALPRSRSILSRLSNILGKPVRNIFEIAIELEDPSKVYSPGDAVKGHIVLTVLKGFSITHLVVALQGYVRVYKHQVTPGDGLPVAGSLFNGIGSKGFEYHGNGVASLFQEEQILCGVGFLRKRVYKFDFRAQFPTKSMPTSIDFEGGSVSYVISATVNRPVVMMPICSTYKRINFRDSIDIESFYTPKSRVITLGPKSRQNVNQTTSQGMHDTSSRGQLSQKNAQCSTATSATIPINEAPLSTAPSDDTMATTASTQSFRQVENRSPVRRPSSETSDTRSSRTSTSAQNITATTELPRHGALPGDSIPVRVSVSHTKPYIKGVVIATLYRLCQIDMYPAVPLATKGKDKEPEYEDVSPKSRTGLWGSFFASASPRSVFRKDLSQSSTMMVVNPTTLTADITTSVKVPASAFPTISNVPGGMISFTYHIEVVIDLFGKLEETRFLPRLTSRHPMFSPTQDGGNQLTLEWSDNILDTSQFRGSKNVVTFELSVTVGTMDSSRNENMPQSHSQEWTAEEWGQEELLMPSQPPQESRSSSSAPALASSAPVMPDGPYTENEAYSDSKLDAKQLSPSDSRAADGGQCEPPKRQTDTESQAPHMVPAEDSAVLLRKTPQAAVLSSEASSDSEDSSGLGFVKMLTQPHGVNATELEADRPQGKARLRDEELSPELLVDEVFSNDNAPEKGASSTETWRQFAGNVGQDLQNDRPIEGYDGLFLKAAKLHVFDLWKYLQLKKNNQHQELENRVAWGTPFASDRVNTAREDNNRAFFVFIVLTIIFLPLCFSYPSFGMHMRSTPGSTGFSNSSWILLLPVTCAPLGLGIAWTVVRLEVGRAMRRKLVIGSRRETPRLQATPLPRKRLLTSASGDSLTSAERESATSVDSLPHQTSSITLASEEICNTVGGSTPGRHQERSTSLQSLLKAPKNWLSLLVIKFKMAVYRTLEPGQMPDQIRIRYNCACRSPLWEDYPVQLATQALELEWRLRSFFRQVERGSAPSGRAERFRSMVGRVTNDLKYLSGSMSRLLFQGLRSPGVDDEGQQNAVPPPEAQSGVYYLTCCSQPGDRRPLLSQAPESEIRGDRDYFYMLNAQAKRIQRPWTKFLAPRKIKAIQYVQMHLLHDNQHVDVLQSIEPQFPKNKEEYSPVESHLREPESLYLGPNTLLHFFEKEHDCCQYPHALLAIPKKLKGKLSVPERGRPAVGWGMHLVDGIDTFKLGLSGFVGLTVSSVVGLVWAKVYRDVQGGSGITQCLMYFVTFVVTMHGVAEVR